MSEFELVVVTSMDGFIARYSGENIGQWTSSEEKARFARCFGGIDWGIMGRVTHEQMYKPERRRIVFSTSTPEPVWHQPNHLWLDPNALQLDKMLALVDLVQPANRNLILGGTRVHDWFLQKDAIDRIQLAIEPLYFASGIPIFSAAVGLNPLPFLLEHGFHLQLSETLNESGTTWHTLARAR